MQRWRDDSLMKTTKSFRLGSLGALAALVGVSVSGQPAGAATVTPDQECATGKAVDPFGLYGDGIRFEVLRNGSSVGSHIVSFARSGEQIETTTRFEVAVDVLFFTAYRYVYTSEATWRGGCLGGMTATTDDNGTKSVVRVARDGKGLVVAGPGGTVETGRTTLPTEHWNSAVLGRDAVINTITGRVNRVDIELAGRETVKTADGRSIAAQRYVYRGELDNEVWYDADGRWVKMRFPAKDGSTIEYVCVKCGTDQLASQS